MRDKDRSEAQNDSSLPFIIIIIQRTVRRKYCMKKCEKRNE